MRYWIVAGMLLAATIAVAAVTVEGKDFKDTETIESKALSSSAPACARMVVDVYVFGAYTESGRCHPNAIIKDDEVKYLRLEICATWAERRWAPPSASRSTRPCPRTPRGAQGAAADLPGLLQGRGEEGSEDRAHLRARRRCDRQAERQGHGSALCRQGFPGSALVDLLRREDLLRGYERSGARRLQGLTHGSAHRRMRHES